MVRRTKLLNCEICDKYCVLCNSAVLTPAVLTDHCWAVNEFCAAAFARNGAHHFRGAVTLQIEELEAALIGLPAPRGGARIFGTPQLRPFLASDGCIGSVAAKVLGVQARPVRAILFDKTGANNWSLAWHQDRTICVREWREVEGFGPWTTKGQAPHVAPPAALLARMVTVRVHLDDVPEDNAPLLIAPGSHLLGRIPESEIEDVIERCGTQACLAEAGDVWLYSTLILHASKAALRGMRRRVLQVDYSAETLPGGLEWYGV